MQLKDRSGVSCDCCGIALQDDFTYYCLDFRQSKVHGGLAPSMDSVRYGPVVSSCDYCTDCYAKLGAQVVVNFRPMGRGLACDLTGQIIVGNDPFYYVDITLVKVHRTGSKFETETSERVLEVNVSHGYYHLWAGKIKTTQEQAQSSWASTSSTSRSAPR